ncbi:hypothetical protein Ddc_17050 [Ditylenchus destructor]|nr:hypothetical protein Ddc_17050 [Ditylenchus destructor]
MQRSALQANLERESEGEPKANKRRLDDRITNIATLDNDTMVEVYKYLNYCGLAKNSLVSKRSRDLIRTHRHKLALLYAKSISMVSHGKDPTVIKIFDKQLSPEAYNEWVICNGYSKQIPRKGQVADMTFFKVYELRADACYKDPKHRDWEDRTSVFYARAEFSHENWPLFQHFIRLLTDPFIYIRGLELAHQIDVFNMLASAMKPEHNRLQCGVLVLLLTSNIHKLIGWIKNHVRCLKFRIYDHRLWNHDEEFLDFFMTGAICTSRIEDCARHTERYDLSNVIVTFVQKFMDVKKCDEQQMVETIECNDADRAIDVLKRDYAKFIVKEEKFEDEGDEDSYQSSTVEVRFKLINCDIGKKLLITTNIHVYNDERSTYVLLEIKNLL